MLDNGQSAVIHTVDPVAIIECIEGHKRCKSPYRHYSFINIEGIREHWTLRVHHLMTTEFDSEKHHIITTKLLDRAWHWYMSYMKWEDEKIDELEDETFMNNK